MCVVRSCISSHDSLIQKPISGKLVWFNEYLCLRLIFHPETLLSLTVILSLIWSLYFSFVYILLNVKYTLKQAKNFITSSLLLIFIFCHKDSSLHTENALWSTSEYFIITILSKEKREWWDSLRLSLPFVDNDINYHFQVASLKNDLLKILTDSACALQVRVKIPLGRC